MTTIPRFFPLVGVPAPRSAAEAKAEAAVRNRAAADRRRARDAADQAFRAQPAALRRGEVLRSPAKSAVASLAAKAQPTPRRAPAPPVAARRFPARASAPARRSRTTIDTEAVYRGRAERKDVCGSCGSHVAGPAHGLRVDNIEPAPKRTLADFVAGYYGGGRAASDRLIGSTTRGGR